jgi:DNA topoisomerase-1
VPRTRRVDCSSPGFARRRAGRGFVYLDEEGERIDDAEALDRIRALAIPPAWREVWICSDPRGHIQATGIDDAGRKQYRYHDDWRARREAAKFDAMVDFARALPDLRRQVARDLRRPDLDAPRVHACAVRLLDIGFFRIGGDDYAARNETYGLTTLLKRHVRVEDDGLVFDYPAKHGVRRRQRVLDPDVREIVVALKRRRGGGPELLAHRNGDAGRWVDVRAADVNGYLKKATGGDFSAKDFRTWNATALAAVALATRAGEVTSRTARRRIVTAAIAEVAAFLGNTPAVCRSAYVDPRVIDRFDAGLTIAHALAERVAPELGEAVGEQPIDERVRRAVLDLIAGDARGRARRTLPVSRPR